MKSPREHKQLEDAIQQTKMDATNIDLYADHERQVKDYLRQASAHHAAASSEPEREEEHIRAGFELVGQARGILGESPVQSDSFRRHQWPFLPPGSE